MDGKKLQQDAFMWFKAKYGKTPGEAGFEVMFPRERRLFFLKIAEQVVFAPDMETAKAFDKAQRYIGNSITLVVLCAVLTISAIIGVGMQVVKDESLIFVGLFSLTGILLGVLVVLLILAYKGKALERCYEGKIIVK